MRTRTRHFAFTLLSFSLLLSLAPACSVDVAANVDVDEKVSYRLDDFGTTCEGTGRSETESGIATWTKTAVGERCRIDVVWSGTLMDMREVNAKAEEQAGDVDLTIQTIRLGFDDVAMRDAQGANITPPRVPSWNAHLTMAGQPLADFAGDDVSALLAGPVSFDLSPDHIALANQALASDSVLPGAGTAMLLVEMSDVAALGAAMGPHLEFHFVASVAANAKKDLL